MHNMFTQSSTLGKDTNTSSFGHQIFTEAERADMKEKLESKLGMDILADRQGPGGSKLTYVEGWRQIELANEIFGYNNWSCTVTEMLIDYVDEVSGKFSAGVSAIVKVQLRDGTYHEDIGYGVSDNNRSKGAALENARKSAVTDARKRALRIFGPGLGNCVYDKQHVKEIHAPPPRPQYSAPPQYQQQQQQQQRPGPPPQQQGQGHSYHQPQQSQLPPTAFPIKPEGFAVPAPHTPISHPAPQSPYQQQQRPLQQPQQQQYTQPTTPQQSPVARSPITPGPSIETVPTTSPPGGITQTPVVTRQGSGGQSYADSYEELDAASIQALMAMEAQSAGGTCPYEPASKKVKA